MLYPVSRDNQEHAKYMYIYIWQFQVHVDINPFIIGLI